MNTELVCVRVEETEELAMGSLDGARAARARAHVEVCEICLEEYDLFVAERALFARRAEMVRPAIELEERVFAAAAECPPPWQARLASATRVVLGLAACVAALVGTGWLDRRFPSIERAPRASESASITASTDEPLACAFPVSGFVRASDRASACATNEGHASIVADRGMCEEAVTSSFATP